MIADGSFCRFQALGFNRLERSGEERINEKILNSFKAFACRGAGLARKLLSMRDQRGPKLNKWPFFLGDILLLAVAYFVSKQSQSPAGPGPILVIFLCVATGAALGALPFVLEYRSLAKLAEAEALSTVVSQIQLLETTAAQISQATNQWQNIQGEAEKVGSTARGLVERIEAEARGFKEAMQKINDAEKATLRLEVEKMRRAEADWLQVSIRLLDHVYALHLGATRSGQPNLIAQVTNFQNACREVARRVGLTPFAADPSEPFDAQRHRLLDGQGQPKAGDTIAETIATGYTFQGRLLRPALVRLNDSNGDVAAQQESDVAMQKL
jgi:molecular chaperone GrpE (heat shock protein)